MPPKYTESRLTRRLQQLVRLSDCDLDCIAPVSRRSFRFSLAGASLAGRNVAKAEGRRSSYSRGNKCNLNKNEWVTNGVIMVSAVIQGFVIVNWWRSSGERRAAVCVGRQSVAGFITFTCLSASIYNHIISVCNSVEACMNLFRYQCNCGV